MSTRRLHAKPPAAKCKGCGHENAIINRADGLGKSCSIHKDAGLRKAADAVAAREAAKAK